MLAENVRCAIQYLIAFLFNCDFQLSFSWAGCNNFSVQIRLHWFGLYLLGTGSIVETASLIATVKFWDVFPSTWLSVHISCGAHQVLGDDSWWILRYIKDCYSGIYYGSSCDIFKHRNCEISLFTDIWFQVKLHLIQTIVTSGLVTIFPSGYQPINHLTSTVAVLQVTFVEDWGIVVSWRYPCPVSAALVFCTNISAISPGWNIQIGLDIIAIQINIILLTPSTVCYLFHCLWLIANWGSIDDVETILLDWCFIRRISQSDFLCNGLVIIDDGDLNIGYWLIIGFINWQDCETVFNFCVTALIWWRNCWIFRNRNKVHCCNWLTFSTILWITGHILCDGDRFHAFCISFDYIDSILSDFNKRNSIFIWCGKGWIDALANIDGEVSTLNDVWGCLINNCDFEIDWVSGLVTEVLLHLPLYLNITVTLITGTGQVVSAELLSLVLPVSHCEDIHSWLVCVDTDLSIQIRLQFTGIFLNI